MAPDVVVVGGDAGEASPAVTEPAAEAMEASADAAVEIAEIEADRDVAIAEIHAGTAAAAIEAEAEADDEEGEIEQCRLEIAGLESRLAQLETRQAETAGLLAGVLVTLEALSTPTPSPGAPEGTEGTQPPPEAEGGTAEDGPREGPETATERRRRRRWL